MSQGGEPDSMPVPSGILCLLLSNHKRNAEGALALQELKALKRRQVVQGEQTVHHAASLCPELPDVSR